MRKCLGFIAAALASTGMFAIGTASAGPINLNLTNESDPGIVSPYATVTITNVTANEVQFHIAVSAGEPVNTKVNLFGLNLNGITETQFAGFTYVNVNDPAYAFGPPNRTLFTNATVFGVFDEVALETSVTTAGPIDFTLAAPFAISPSNFERFNGVAIFALQFFPDDPTNIGAGTQGFVYNESLTPVPEPSTLVLSLIGAFTLLSIFIYRKKETILNP